MNGPVTPWLPNVLFPIHLNWWTGNIILSFLKQEWPNSEKNNNNNKTTQKQKIILEDFGTSSGIKRNFNTKFNSKAKLRVEDNFEANSKLRMMTQMHENESNVG